MIPKLTDDQRQAVEAGGGTPVYLVDALTNDSYVLLRAEQFEKLKGRLEAEEEFNPREAYPLLERVMRDDDAEDPALAQYQHFPKQTP